MAHMSAMIRIKELAQKSAQDRSNIISKTHVPLGALSSLPDFLARIDGNYYTKCGELGPMKEIAGDCYDYFNNID